MSRNAEVTLDWADGTYKFRLGIGQLREVQEKCDAGPGELALRTENIFGSYRVDDVREPIRAGLIGGGLEPAKALKLVKRYVDDRPLAENVLAAHAILLAAVIGVEDEPLGKFGVATEKAIPSQGANSVSPRSTPAAH